jgi:hypothetical protein
MFERGRDSGDAKQLIVEALGSSRRFHPVVAKLTAPAVADPPDWRQTNDVRAADVMFIVAAFPRPSPMTRDHKFPR